ncbi:HTH-type transcriptional regulator YidZ [Methylobacterium phyllosphaerae]|uniref:DNA-binding transcriptional regulator, LysR family n=2 Tax=Methylobacterium phyllosphaerae TaxID=418223 RepID=A0AAE8HV50_9HYPH|nr:HTH-type transcriptional regulator YidZ [Methylobacterium phyllosphaerae]SFH34944.1 DNA-binding transcriptional regulator, LysR family [Methylobacterium phyllosphaerae]
MDFHGLDLNLIVAFDALMEERHVTRAARRIGLTQPAMSAALARLRKATGDELFVRGPKGLAPTPRAQDLAAPFKGALRAVGEALALRDDFRPAEASVVFTLALSEHPAHVLLPPLAEALAAAAPGVDLHIRGFTDRNEAVRLLDEGLADVAVGVPPGTEARILARPLFRERFVSVARSGSPAAECLGDAAAFAAARHVLVSPEGDGFGAVDEALSERGLRRRLGVVLPQMYAAPALVARTDLVATLMEGVVTGSGMAPLLTVRPCPVELAPVEFHLLWHRRSDRHPAQAWLRDLLVSSAPSG